LVLAAVALVVLHRPEDLRAEQTVALRLEGSVVDRLRLLHFTVGPFADLVRRRERNADRAERKRVLRLLEEVEDVFHGSSSLLPDRAGLIDVVHTRRDLTAFFVTTARERATHRAAVGAHFVASLVLVGQGALVVVATGLAVGYVGRGEAGLTTSLHVAGLD